MRRARATVARSEETTVLVVGWAVLLALLVASVVGASACRPPEPDDPPSSVSFANSIPTERADAYGDCVVPSCDDTGLR